MTGLTAAVATLGITAGLAGCGAESGSDTVTLKMVAADYGDSPANSTQKYWDKVSADFESKNPGIRVDVDVRSWSEVDAHVAALVKKGEAPDIAQIGAYADYAAQGKLYSADDLLSIPVQADFLPALSEAGELRRVQYGMPFASSTRLLFYNKDLFAKAGVTGTPQSWTELAADARKLKAAGVKYPFALPLGREEAPAETLMWLLSGGDGYTDNVGTYTLDSDQNIKTFKWLRDDLVGKGLTGPTAPGELDRQDAFDAFSRGEVGMLNGHPTLMKQAEKQGVEYGMVPLPGVNGKAKATLGVADWMMGFKENGHKEEIGKFLDFVYDDENVLDFSERYDILPVTSSASDAMADEPEYKHLREFLEELPDSELYPVGKTSWAQVSASIKKEIGKAVRPGGDPAEILQELQNEAVAAESAE
ncbi:extracellular solute-binding protein [Streptomyces luteolus]|uniref:Extracellular solute-binding protein n=1 Tax=Streptomyces luteolus TaxID=3043615 RepID=A0ABT6SS56_9ACTN|nr:extracellular solute-binding protein [Streptomyces sp. B-S-A12]MDI3418075.1 extracellular solute-binding protein [Streptomyces sp. B-S-A12]